MSVLVVLALLFCSVIADGAEKTQDPIGDKTLVAWVAPANLQQRGGGVVSLENPDASFDAIVLGEVADGKWMAGSEEFHRTQRDQSAWPAEAAGGALVQVAIVYHGKQIVLYRNAKELARYAIERPQEFSGESLVLLGLRHRGAPPGKGFFAGAIDDCRIYAGALDASQLGKLEPNRPAQPAPIAWWTFENGSADDLMKRFPKSRLAGGARVADGKLVLDGKHSYLIAGPLDRGFPAFFLPEGRPFGDTFPLFKDGQWHLFCMWMPQFGHFVTRDLVHWEKRPPTPFGGCTGCVLEHAGTYYFFYTGGGQQIWLATSKDLEQWEPHRGNPLLVGDGKRYDPGYFRDPFVFYHAAENCWWMLMGSQYVADRVPGSPTGCVALAKSKDLLRWELADPLWAPRLTAHCDCPQVVQQGDRWFLLYLHRNTRYRFAESLAGPWQRPPVRDLGTVFAAANSRPASDGKRWISWPFIAAAAEPRDTARFGYGGPLGVPRQWQFHDDGTITQQVPDEVLAALHAEPAPRRPLDGAGQLAGRWDLTGTTAKSLAPAGGMLRLAETPANFYFEADVTLDRADAEAHVLMNLLGDPFACYSIALSPRENLVRLQGTDALDRVLEILPAPLAAGRPMKLRVFRSGSIVEVFVDDKFILTQRVYQHRGGQLALEFIDGSGSFANIVVRRLAGLGE